MDKTTDGKNIILKHQKCLSLPLTLDCGQAFRWKEIDEGKWQGIAFGKELILEQKNDEITFFNTDEDTFAKIWSNYFDLNTDYDNILTSLSQDSLLGDTIKEYYGIRILCQDSFEALFTFIFSSSNNIKRIKGFVEKIAVHYGEQINDGVFAFPTAEELRDVSVADYRELGAGYRDVFLRDCVEKVLNEEIDLAKIKAMSLEDARNTLMTVKGVGRKVADCSLLFGFNKLECFPIDRWIKRVLDLYPEGLPPYFKGYEGIAQQYMFHYARMNLAPESKSKK